MTAVPQMPVEIPQMQATPEASDKRCGVPCPDIPELMCDMPADAPHEHHAFLPGGREGVGWQDRVVFAEDLT